MKKKIKHGTLKLKIFKAGGYIGFDKNCEGSVYNMYPLWFLNCWIVIAIPIGPIG